MFFGFFAHLCKPRLNWVRVYVTPVLSLMGETFYQNNDVLVTPVLTAMCDVFHD